MSEWLYGDGAHAASEVIQARLDELNALVDPIKARIREEADRPRLLQGLQDVIGQTQMMIDRMRDEVANAAVAASKSAEEAASAASESIASSVSSQNTETTVPAAESSAESSADPLDDLEEPAASSSTTSSREPSATPAVPTYTEEDVTTLQTALDKIKNWLDERLEKQSKLSPADDPVLLTSELEEKARDLQAELMGLLRRKMAGFNDGRGKKKGGNKTGSKKGKGKKGKSTSASGEEEATPVEKKPEESGAESPERPRDEL